MFVLIKAQIIRSMISIYSLIRRCRCHDPPEVSMRTCECVMCLRMFVVKKCSAMMDDTNECMQCPADVSRPVTSMRVCQCAVPVISVNVRCKCQCPMLRLTSSSFFRVNALMCRSKWFMPFGGNVKT